MLEAVLFMLSSRILATIALSTTGFLINTHLAAGNIVGSNIDPVVNGSGISMRFKSPPTDQSGCLIQSNYINSLLEPVWIEDLIIK